MAIPIVKIGGKLHFPSQRTTNNENSPSGVKRSCDDREQTTIKLDTMNKSAMKSERLVVSYALWLGAFMGLGGLHRLYNGKIGSGLLWLFTWGIFGFGQFIDLFLIPNMNEEYEMKLRLKMGMTAAGIPIDSTTSAPTQVIPPSPQPTTETLRLRILKAAQKRDGQISVTQAVLDTGADFEEVEAELTEMVKKGYASIENHHTKGTIFYEFPEM